MKANILLNLNDKKIDDWDSFDYIKNAEQLEKARQQTEDLKKLMNKPDNEEWGNIELPGLSDEKLFNTNWEKIGQGRHNALDPTWQKKQAEAQERRSKTDWSKKMLGNKNGINGKSRTGWINSEESNKRRSEALIGIERHNLRGVPKPKLTCPHCGKEGGKPQMIQYHFDKCKHK